MADKRAYFKVDVGYFTNPKTANLCIERPAAVILHLASIAYGAQHLTDGIVPELLLLRLTGATTDDADALVGADVWHRTDHGCQRCAQPASGHVVIHDFLEHQRSAAEAKRLSEAGAKGAAARWSAEGSANRIAEGNAEGNGQREREKEREEDSAREPDRFPEFWSLYPRKVKRPQAMKAFKAASKRADPEDIIESLRRQLPWFQSQVKNGEDFRPHPASWLNGERWTEGLTAPAPQRSIEERRAAGEFWL